MKHWVILAVIAILASVAGCERRECDYVKNTKGDQICREDVEPENESEQAETEQGWRAERETPK